MYSSSKLFESHNYIWSDADIVGEGAAGAVYRARNKNSGDVVAAKIFKDSLMRMHVRLREPQIREFDVLQKLDHANIVRLLTIEEERKSRGQVLIMEFCSGGSLYSLLSQPENQYGIEEEEFFLALDHIAQGMKHLRDRDVVHRDIKPGNIMRYIEDDGRSIYKLVDFGSSRDLKDGEEFMSLHGTQEYLKPDMYERAIIRGGSNKYFSAKVDLWSLGVTFYHLAAGQLPFRPYGGRNPGSDAMMFEITSKKKSGVISGVQPTPASHIEYSRELPSNCRLSRPAKELITPLLAGLLENDENIMLSYKEFFEEAERICSKVCVHIANLNTASQVRVYADRTASFSLFKELITKETDIHASQQCLIFDYNCLTHLVTPSQTVSSYPETSIENPYFLFSAEQEPRNSVKKIDIPNFEAASSKEIDIRVEAHNGKLNCSTAYMIKRHVDSSYQMLKFLKMGLWQYIMVVRKDLEHVKFYVNQFHTLFTETIRNVRFFIHSIEMQSKLIGVIQNQSNTNEKFKEELLILNSELEQFMTSMKAILVELDETAAQISMSQQEIEVDFSIIMDQGLLYQQFVRGDNSNDKRFAITKHMVSTIQSLYDSIKNKQKKGLKEIYDQQFVKCDRHKLYNYCLKSMASLEQFVETLEKEHGLFWKKLDPVREIKKKLWQIEKSTSQNEQSHTQISKDMNVHFNLYLSQIEACICSYTSVGENHFPIPERNYSNVSISDSQHDIVKQINTSLSYFLDESNQVKSAVNDGCFLLKQLESFCLVHTDLLDLTIDEVDV